MTKKSMVRSGGGVKIVDTRLTKALIQMKNMSKANDQLSKANIVRWYEQVLRKDKNNFLRRALDINVKGTRKSCRPKITWQKAVVEQSRKVGLSYS